MRICEWRRRKERLNTPLALSLSLISPENERAAFPSDVLMAFLAVGGTCTTAPRAGGRTRSRHLAQWVAEQQAERQAPLRERGHRRVRENQRRAPMVALPLLVGARLDTRPRCGDDRVSDVIECDRAAERLLERPGPGAHDVQEAPEARVDGPGVPAEVGAPELVDLRRE